MSPLLLAVALPLAFALAALAIPSERVRPWLIPIAALCQVPLLAALASSARPADQNRWLGLDPLGTLLLAYLTVFFVCCACYAPAYLRLRAERPNRVFCTMMLVFFAMLNLYGISQHVGLMWIAIEATTLATGPLLYFNRNPRSIEATWKYLLIGSVGIAIALLGTFFLGYSALRAGLESSLVIGDVIAHAADLSRPWLRAAVVLLLIGYGTKMGLAPMHTWKPDAYGEAPGLVGAILAGGVTSCAFIGVLRFYSVAVAAGDAGFARELLLAFGLMSMAVGGVFMVRQRDYKRMLAYSSVEHMGILVLGASVGGAGLFGSLFHMLNNGFTKGVLFLSAANIHRHFGSRSIDSVQGALRALPASATLFLIGFFAVTGAPPFAPFLSEFTILRAAVADGRIALAFAFLALLLLVFIGMGATVLAVVQGEQSPTHDPARARERFAQIAPILALLALVLLLGLWIPARLEAALWAAARFIEGTR
ncbi:MAG TPA: proton-conducting transporter membrane subunit [Myxococcota bacterium]|nr:proton-conducting transporter membrane subunit [Myxococcota bacterium]